MHRAIIVIAFVFPRFVGAAQLSLDDAPQRRARVRLRRLALDARAHRRLRKNDPSRSCTARAGGTGGRTIAHPAGLGNRIRGDAAYRCSHGRRDDHRATAFIIRRASCVSALERDRMAAWVQPFSGGRASAVVIASLVAVASPVVVAALVVVASPVVVASGFIALRPSSCAEEMPEEWACAPQYPPHSLSRK